MVFESLSFMDLVNVATLNPRYHEIIVMRLIPRLKLDEGTVHIRLSGSDSMRIFHDIDGYYHELVEGHNETLLAIQLFGYLFEQIKLSLMHDGYETAVDFFSSTRPTGEPMYTFPNANRVIFDGNDVFGQLNVDINKMFPNVGDLVLEGTSNFPFASLEFKHLKHFEMQRITNDIDNLISFMRLHPQLESFTASMECKHNYLQELSEFLPNLKALNIKYSYESRNFLLKPSNEVHFRNVKHFVLTIDDDDHAIDTAARDILSSIVFDRLETFTLNADVDREKRFFIDLIARHQHLFSVHLNKFGLNEKAWSYLVRVVPNLQQVTISCPSQSDIWTMIRFFEIRRSLKRVLVNMDASGVELIRHIEEQGIERAYRISSIEDTSQSDGKLVTFERNEDDVVEI